MSKMNNERKLGGVLEYLYAGGGLEVNEEECICVNVRMEKSICVLREPA